MHQTLTIDTLKCFKTLRAGGFSDQMAEALSYALYDALKEKGSSPTSGPKRGD